MITKRNNGKEITIKGLSNFDNYLEQAETALKALATDKPNAALTSVFASPSPDPSKRERSDSDREFNYKSSDAQNTNYY